MWSPAYNKKKPKTRRAIDKECDGFRERNCRERKNGWEEELERSKRNLLISIPFQFHCQFLSSQLPCYKPTKLINVGSLSSLSSCIYGFLSDLSSVLLFGCICSWRFPHFFPNFEDPFGRMLMKLWHCWNPEFRCSNSVVIFVFWLVIWYTHVLILFYF